MARHLDQILDPFEDPAVPPDICVLIRTMAQANLLWGAPRIHGELMMLGIDKSQARVAKCRDGLKKADESAAPLPSTPPGQRGREVGRPGGRPSHWRTRRVRQIPCYELNGGPPCWSERWTIWLLGKARSAHHCGRVIDFCTETMAWE
jgi:hypothetical protein